MYVVPCAFSGRAVTVRGLPTHLFALEIDSRHLIILKDNPWLLMGQEKVGDGMSAGKTKLSIYPTVSIIPCERQK